MFGYFYQISFLNIFSHLYNACGPLPPRSKKIENPCSYKLYHNITGYVVAREIIAIRASIT